MIITDKLTIATDAPIPGWECWPDPADIQERTVWVCTPSDDYIRERAYFRFVTQSPPGASDFANWITAEEDFIWITAEEDFIVARGNGLPPL